MTLDIACVCTSNRENRDLGMYPFGMEQLLQFVFEEKKYQDDIVIDTFFASDKPRSDYMIIDNYEIRVNHIQSIFPDNNNKLYDIVMYYGCNNPFLIFNIWAMTGVKYKDNNKLFANIPRLYNRLKNKNSFIIFHEIPLRFKQNPSELTYYLEHDDTFVSIHRMISFFTSPIYDQIDLETEFRKYFSETYYIGYGFIYTPIAQYRAPVRRRSYDMTCRFDKCYKNKFGRSRERRNSPI